MDDFRAAILGFVAGLFLFIAYFSPLSAQAANGTCEPVVATAVSIQGIVEVQAAGGSTWQPLLSNQSLCPGDAVRVLDNGRAALSGSSGIRPRVRTVKRR